MEKKSAELSGLKSYTVLNNKFYQVRPAGLQVLTQGHPGLKGISFALLREMFFPAPRHPKIFDPKYDESVYDFVARRLTPNLAEYIGRVIAQGIYGSDLRNLSIRATFPQLYEWERDYGSLIRGARWEKKRKAADSSYHISRVPTDEVDEFRSFIINYGYWPSISFSDGQSSLTNRLEGAIRKHSAAEVRTSARCVAIDKTEAGLLRVTTEDQRTVDADYVISTLPAPAHRLIRFGAVAEPSTLNDMFALIGEYTDVAVVNFGFRKVRGSVPPSDIGGGSYHRSGSAEISGANKLTVAALHRTAGVLLHPDQDDLVLGMMVDSSVRPHRQRTSTDTYDELRIGVFIGGHKFAKILGPHYREKLTEEFLRRTAMEALQRYTEMTDDPTAVTVTLNQQCLPVPRLGHAERAKTLRETAADLFSGRLTLIGDAYGEAGISNRIKHALQAADVVRAQCA